MELLEFIDKYGNVASFLGLLLSLITLILTGTVKSRVNSILKVQKSENEIASNRATYLNNLDSILTYVKTGKVNQVFSRESYEQLETIYQCFVRNWDTLNSLDNHFVKISNKMIFHFKWWRLKKVYSDKIKEQDEKKIEFEEIKYIRYLIYLKGFIR